MLAATPMLTVSGCLGSPSQLPVAQRHLRSLEPYAYEAINGPGNLAILHRSPEELLMVACGDALIEVAVGLYGMPEEATDDAPDGVTGSEQEIIAAYAEKLIEHCSENED